MILLEMFFFISKPSQDPAQEVFDEGLIGIPRSTKSLSCTLIVFVVTPLPDVVGVREINGWVDPHD